LNIGFKQVSGNNTLNVNMGRYLARTKISYAHSPLNPSVGGTPATSMAPEIPATAESLAGVGNGFPDADKPEILGALRAASRVRTHSRLALSGA
jgi:hypothetical protein